MSPQLPDRARRWASRLALWALIGFLGYSLVSQLSQGTLVERGDEAPTLRGETFGGGGFDLAAQRSGVTVVNFWATWCPPCRAEAPALARAHRRLEPGGGGVIGVSMDGGSLDEVGAAAREFGMSYPIMMGSGKVQDAFRVQQLPTTYVVGPGGRIAASAVGAVTDDWLEAAIGEAQSH